MRKKKEMGVAEPMESTVMSTSEVKVVFEQPIKLLELNLDSLHVTHDQLRAVVDKLNEIIRKVN